MIFGLNGVVGRIVRHRQAVELVASMAHRHQTPQRTPLDGRKVKANHRVSRIGHTRKIATLKTKRVALVALLAHEAGFLPLNLQVGK